MSETKEVSDISLNIYLNGVARTITAASLRKMTLEQVRDLAILLTLLNDFPILTDTFMWGVFVDKLLPPVENVQ